MFNIELKKKSYKISFKSLLVKIQWSKTDREQGVGGDWHKMQEEKSVLPLSVKLAKIIPNSGKGI